MDQDPNTPKYDRVTGLLTDYGRSLGLKEVNRPTSISSDTLQSNPTPLKLPEDTTTSNPSFNLTPLETEAEKIAKIKTTQESDITSLLKEMGGVQGKEGQYQEDLGATKARQDFDQYSADLEQEKRNMEKFERDILRNNPTGALRGGQADLLKNAQRESLQKQADLAILGNASLGKYNTALEIAKNKVEMELKPLQAELDAKKFIYEQNKDLFSTAQLSKLNSLIKADEIKLEEEKANKLKANEMIINAMQGKAPQSLISKAKDMLTQGKTPTEIAGVLGNYSLSEGDRLDLSIKRAQLSKLNSELVEKNPDAGELVKIGGKDYIRYKDGSISEPVLPEAKDTGMVVSRLTDKIKVIDELAKNNGGVPLATSAGSFRGAPVPFAFKNQINNWRAGIINLTQKLTVDELGRVKSDGVTFGALSNGERLAVGQAATILNSGMIYKGSGDDKTPTGKFKLGEKKVLDALDTIKKGYILDFERRTGVSYEEYLKNPEIVNQQVADDFIDSALEVNNYGGYTLD